MEAVKRPGSFAASAAFTSCSHALRKAAVPGTGVIAFDIVPALRLFDMIVARHRRRQGTGTDRKLGSMVTRGPYLGVPIAC